MAYFDLSLPELKQYLPKREEASDFDAFWSETIAESQKVALDPIYDKVDFGLTLVDTYDVTFKGFGGQSVKAWLILPAIRPEPLPCVVEYIGYGGGRSFPYNWLVFSNAGYAHLIMDTRGQGSAWTHGDTPDQEPENSNPHFPGFMTRGIQSRETYYYRRVFTDAVRAIETARAFPDIDSQHIAVSGGSQGGGITLAAAGLVPSVEVCLPDVPFLCQYRRATQIIDTMPYAEISSYLKVHRDKSEQAFKTLSYFDGVNFSSRAKAKALFSVGLMDDICPPSTVFAAYNHYAGTKEIRVYDYNKHEGGGEYHLKEKVQFLKRIWG